MVMIQQKYAIVLVTLTVIRCISGDPPGSYEQAATSTSACDNSDRYKSTVPAGKSTAYCCRYVAEPVHGKELGCICNGACESDGNCPTTCPYCVRIWPDALSGRGLCMGL